MSRDKTRRRIIEESMRAFGAKGCRFSLTDIESGLQMSRRTIYAYFSSKEEILKTLIDETGQEILEKQRAIYADDSLSTREKLHRLLTVETTEEKIIPAEKLYELEKYYPAAYAYLLRKYEEQWEYVGLVLEQGITQGVFAQHNTEIVKKLLQSGMQMLVRGDFLERNGLAYQQALREVVDIVIGGIAVRGQSGREK